MAFTSSSSSAAFSALFNHFDSSAGASTAETSPYPYPDQFAPSSSPTSPASTFDMLPGSFLPLPTSAGADTYLAGTGYDYYSCLAPSSFLSASSDQASNASSIQLQAQHQHANASSSSSSSSCFLYGTATTRAQSHDHQSSSRGHAIQCLPSFPAKTTDPLDAHIALAAQVAPVAANDPCWAGQAGQQQLRDHAPFSINLAPVHPPSAHMRFPSWPTEFAGCAGISIGGGANKSSPTSLVDSLLFGNASGRRDELPNVSQSQHQWTNLNAHTAASSAVSCASSSTASPSVTVTSTPCLTSLFGPALACDTSSLAASPAVGPPIMNATVSFPASSAWQLPTESDHNSLMFPLDSLMRPAHHALESTPSWIAPAAPSRITESPVPPANQRNAHEPATCLYASPSVLTCASSTAGCAGTGTSVSSGASSASPVNVFGNAAHRTVQFPRLSLAAAIAFDETCASPISPTSTCSSSVSPSDMYSFHSSSQQSPVGYNAYSVAAPTTPCPQARHDVVDAHTTGASNSSMYSPASPTPTAARPLGTSDVFAELDTILTRHAPTSTTRSCLADALRFAAPARTPTFDTASLSSSPSTVSRVGSESSLSPAPSSTRSRSSVSPATATTPPPATDVSDTDSADEYLPSPSPTVPSTLARSTRARRPTAQGGGRSGSGTSSGTGAKTKPPPASVHQAQAQAQAPAARPARTTNRRARHRCPHPGCERVFCQLTHLRTHVRTHTGERPHVCPHPGCGQSFAQSGNLVTHMRGHTGEKPYICSVCNRAFAQLGNLRTHERMHSGDRPYRCIIDGCQSQFSQLGNLRTHQLRLHSIPRGSDLAGLAIVSLDRSIHAAATAAFRINRRGQVVSADAESDEDDEGPLSIAEENGVPAEIKVENEDVSVSMDLDEDEEVAVVAACVEAAKKTPAAKPASRKRKTRSAAASADEAEEEVKIKVEPTCEEIEQPAPKKRRRSTRRATTRASDSLEPAIELPQPAPVAMSTPSAEPEVQIVGHYPPSRPYVPIMPHPHVMPPPAFQQPLQYPMVIPGSLPSQPLLPPPSVYVPNPLRLGPQPTFGAGYSDYHNQAWMSAQLTTAGGKYVPIAPAPSASASTSDPLALPRLSRAAASAAASGRKSPVSFMR